MASFSRPRLLKDFLAHDLSSSSSNGFRSPPRNPCDSTVRSLIRLDLEPADSATGELLRSRSRAASATFSVIHRASEIAVNAVKYLPFGSGKAPSVLLRGISRRLSKRKELKVREIKVRDILRWKSFRDFADDESPPSDFNSSPLRSVATTSTTTSGNGSSWCDSDFASDCSPFWCGKSDGYVSEDHLASGKKYLPSCGGGINYMEATTAELADLDPQGQLLCAEEEQHSPVSVHNFPFGEDDDEEKEIEVEEKARQVLNRVALVASSFVDGRSKGAVETLLLDYFREELDGTRRSERDDGTDYQTEMVRVAEDWIRGENNGCSPTWEEEGKKEACVRDMETGGRWKELREERQEVGTDIESEVLGHLVDEVLSDLVTNSVQMRETRALKCTYTCQF